MNQNYDKIWKKLDIGCMFSLKKKNSQLWEIQDNSVHMMLFCPLTQIWHVNCPSNCPITLSNYKHDVYTNLLVLKSAWW